MTAIQPTTEDITELQSLIGFSDACVTLEDADALEKPHPGAHFARLVRLGERRQASYVDALQDLSAGTLAGGWPFYIESASR